MSEQKVDERGFPCVVCQVWLPCELLQAVAEAARAQGLSDSRFVEKALRECLGLDDKKDTES